MKQTHYFCRPQSSLSFRRYSGLISAHFNFLLSVYPKEKQIPMDTEILIFKMHPYLSNKLLSWKPSKVSENLFSNHYWQGMQCPAGFSGWKALKKSSVQEENLTKKKLGVRSNHPCLSGLRLFLIVFLELSREVLITFFCLYLPHVESQTWQRS